MATYAMGTTLKFTPTGGSQVTLGKLTSIGEIAPDSEELDITTLDSEGGYREYMQGLKTSGEVTLAGYHDKTDAGQTALRAAYASGAAGAFLVSFPDGTTAAFSAFVKGYKLGAAEIDKAVEFEITLRLTGAVTVSAV